MSEDMLEQILTDNVHGFTEDDLSEDQIRHVKAMITSEKGGAPAPAGKRWLYEVCFSFFSCHLCIPFSLVSSLHWAGANAAAGG